MDRFEEVQGIILSAHPAEGMAPSNGTVLRERTEADTLRKQLEADLNLQWNLVRRQATGDPLVKLLLDPMDRLIEIRMHRLADAEQTGR